MKNNGNSEENLPVNTDEWLDHHANSPCTQQHQGILVRILTALGWIKTIVEIPPLNGDIPEKEIH